MAKRFTDSEKWKKKWFRSLTSDEKVFWFYLLDSCNLAGIWEVDFELAKMFCGKANEKEIRESFKKQYIEICEGRHWIVLDFIRFQYGELTENNPLHKKVVAVLRMFGAYDIYLTIKEAPVQPLNSPLQGAQDKDKDMVEEKDKDREKEWDKVKERKEWFESIWLRYPSKDGKGAAERHFMASVVTIGDLTNINNALDNYLKSERVKKGFVKNGSTWFNDWQGWVNPTPEMLGGGQNGRKQKSTTIEYDSSKYDNISK